MIIENGRALLIRRGGEPLKGQWSIPGGTLELGESLPQGVIRELREETGLDVRVLELIEVFDRIFPENEVPTRERPSKPRYHFVIVDYLCEKVGGEARAGSDVTDAVFVREDELQNYGLTVTATRILKRAFVMERERRAAR